MTFEKLAIFDNGYDDKVMELLKLALYAMVMEQNPEMEIDRNYYFHRNEEPEILFVMTDGSQLTTAFPVELYKDISKMAADKLK